MKYYFLSIFCIAILCTACKNDPVSDFKGLDLLEYGVPLTIKAPEGATVLKKKIGFTNDITIKKDDDYSIQLFSSSATTTDISKLKNDQLDEVKSSRYFSKIVKDEEAGFVYETQIDSTYKNYGFRYVLVQGDNEYIFRTGMMGTFTQVQAETMFESVKVK